MLELAPISSFEFQMAHVNMNKSAENNVKTLGGEEDEEGEDGKRDENGGGEVISRERNSDFPFFTLFQSIFDE